MSAKTSKLTVSVADDGKQAKQALPLAMKVPNAETQAAMAESRLLMASRQASGTESGPVPDEPLHHSHSRPN